MKVQVEQIDMRELWIHHLEVVFVLAVDLKLSNVPAGEVNHQLCNRVIADAEKRHKPKERHGTNA